MDDFQEQCQTVQCDAVFFLILFKTIYKTIIRLGFCEIWNNQGIGKCHQPQPSARLITLSSTLISLDITKTKSNNFFKCSN